MHQDCPLAAGIGKPLQMRIGDGKPQCMLGWTDARSLKQCYSACSIAAGIFATDMSDRATWLSS